MLPTATRSNFLFLFYEGVELTDIFTFDAESCPLFSLRNFKAVFLETLFFKSWTSKCCISDSFALRRLGEVSIDPKFYLVLGSGLNSIPQKWDIYLDSHKQVLISYLVLGLIEWCISFHFWLLQFWTFLASAFTIYLSYWCFRPLLKGWDTSFVTSHINQTITVLSTLYSLTTILKNIIFSWNLEEKFRPENLLYWNVNILSRFRGC